MRKKKKHLDFEAMAPLKHNPFAKLGTKFGTEPNPAGTETINGPSESMRNRQQAMLVVRLEKRKKGKVVTCVYHVEQGQKELLRRLTKKLATGGTIQDGIIEVRGDLREKLSPLLEELGYRVGTGK